MATNTKNLKLLKKNVETDGLDTFNIETMLNNNWDKIDTAFGKTVYGNEVHGLRINVNKNIEYYNTETSQWIEVKSGVDGAPIKSYNHKIQATSNGQTDFKIPLITFNPEVDILLVMQNRTVLESDAYSIVKTEAYYYVRLVEAVKDYTKTAISLFLIKGNVMVSDVVEFPAASTSEAGIVTLTNNLGTSEELAVTQKALNTVSTTKADKSQIVSVEETLSSVNSKVGTVDEKVTAVDSKVSSVSEKVTLVDGRVTEVDTKVNNAGDRITTVDNRVTTVDNKVNAVDAKTGNLGGLSFGSKSNVVTSLNELFQYADSGKAAVRNAVIGKGTWVPESPSFEQLAASVMGIETGMKFHRGTLQANGYVVSTSEIPFRPKILVVWGITDVASFALYVEESPLGYGNMFRYDVVDGLANRFVITDNGFSANYEIYDVRPNARGGTYSYIAFTY